MGKNKTIHWRVTQQTPTLQHLCRCALQHGAHCIYLAGQGLQPVVIVPLHHWRELQHKAQHKRR